MSEGEIVILAIGFFVTSWIVASAIVDQLKRIANALERKDRT